eukprot:COSAG01_NODE_43718_length_426_cov_1232.195719_1_plen_136_part_01
MLGNRCLDHTEKPPSRPTDYVIRHILHISRPTSNVGSEWRKSTRIIDRISQRSNRHAPGVTAAAVLAAASAAVARISPPPLRPPPLRRPPSPGPSPTPSAVPSCAQLWRAGTPQYVWGQWYYDLGPLEPGVGGWGG